MGNRLETCQFFIPKFDCSSPQRNNIGWTCQELIVQLRHYSPASKREALAGLKSIVDRHRAFAEVTFARLAEASLELVVCFDSDVRK